MWHICRIEYYSAIKNRDSAFSHDRTDLEVIMLSEISQKRKDECYYVLTSVWGKKSQTHQIQERKSTMLVARNLGIREIGKCWSKCADF